MKTINTSHLRTPLFRLTLLLAIMTTIILQGFSQEVVVTNPASPWAVPAGVTSIKVEVWGGGGRGGLRTNSTNNLPLAGGGGGAYSMSVLTVTPGTNYTITVGQGSTSIAAGGDSWFGSTSTILAKGGISVADNSNAPGAGGLSSQGVGNVKFNGGNGALGIGGNYGGGGGSSAGTSLIGNYTNMTTTIRNGATAPSGGGNGGTGAAITVAGLDGIVPGGGGGGGFRAGTGSTQNPGNGASGMVKLTWTTCTSPSIQSPPTSRTVCSGSSATFSVTAGGTSPTYQWYKGTTPITGATSAAYTINSVSQADAATNYNVVITGACGTVTSNNVTLTVRPLPLVTVTNQSDLSCFGVSTGQITIQASGGLAPYTFSIHNGLNADYTGSGNPYTFSNLSAGNYRVRVKDSNQCESIQIP